MGFVEKLLTAARGNDSWLCVGLDISPDLLPSSLPRTLSGMLEFNRAIIEAVADLVCAFKPNLAFYEALGVTGLDLLTGTLELIPAGVPVIADAKRADIGNTSRAYARALFDELGFDAATVNPYLGYDALLPFLEYADRGVFVLCRTSNPGASDFQDLVVGDRPLYQVVALKANQWNFNNNVGLVVGATCPDDLRAVRQIAPSLPLLVPGIGAQGGDLGATVAAGADTEGEMAIINSSRQIIYASGSKNYAQAARQEAQSLREAINRLRR